MNLTVGIAVVFASIVVAFVFARIVSLQDSLATAQQTHSALCALREDKQQQVQGGKDYLLKHPAGAPALGLSRADILRSIEQNEHTLRALRSLKCE